MDRAKEANWVGVKGENWRFANKLGSGSANQAGRLKGIFKLGDIYVG